MISRLLTIIINHGQHASRQVAPKAAAAPAPAAPAPAAQAPRAPAAPAPAPASPSYAVEGVEEEARCQLFPALWIWAFYGMTSSDNEWMTSSYDVAMGQY